MMDGNDDQKEKDNSFPDGCTFGQWFLRPSRTSKIQEGLLPQCMEWTSWLQMANQAGLSRVYGGIHYPSSHLGGMALGEWVTHTLLNDFLGSQFMSKG